MVIITLEGRISNMCDCINCRNKGLLYDQLRTYGSAYGERWCESVESQASNLKCLNDKKENQSDK